MGVHDEYRALAGAAMAKASAGQQQQQQQQQQGYHGVDPDEVAARIVDRMLHGMLVADLAAGNLGGVEAAVPAP
ncbi:hypothetical protein AMAG_18737 [Allomyces macrogynus ATCC 38327]|uniref:Uncharacterized protein n=1 Tax=Allomyces macrogynus (strain ATCC 38327) TaxID=578462 RepID=A0A0L0SF53_ALLM3|nr:hypothetical protein AMAG_18736 [Allomyces macrogynus ATCC 38327]KNE61065.1 hypothetical protein AMAG_18737 [Allomyces macrogynus ATCC 38327]|eukprot:KNE61064.1 hypothetical protein AMAG_18736 [Allomyces macrogynus ATCC 38327]